MKVLFFFAPLAETCEKILLIQTEIIYNLLEKGYEVDIVIDFSKAVFSSQVLQEYVTASSYKYRIFFKKFLSLMNSRKEKITIGTYRLKSQTTSIRRKDLNFESIDELKKLEYKCINIGYGVCSSVISLNRDHGINPSKNKKKILKEVLVSEVVIDTLEFYTKNQKYNEVYFFNGRLSSFYPIKKYCEEYQIHYKVFEITNRDTHYHLVNNSIPHEINYRYKEMMNLWKDDNTHSMKEKVEIASTYFEARKEGFDNVFLRFQEKGALNNYANKRVVSFFNSSIDEYASVPNWEEYVYNFTDEVEAIETICKAFEEDSDIQFILRIHPNLKFLKNKQTEMLNRLLGLSNLEIIVAHAKVSSYELIDASDLVVVFGSTVGVEACFSGKPVVCLGKSFYEKLNVAYIPKNKKELFEYIRNINLQPKNHANSLIYGYWLTNFGEKLTYQMEGLHQDYYQLSYFQNLLFKFFKTFGRRNVLGLSKLCNKDFYMALSSSAQRKHLLRKLKLLK